MNLTLEEFVEKYGQVQAAKVLQVTQSAVSQALKIGRKVFFIMKKDGTIARVYRETDLPFQQLKLHEIER